MPLAQHLRATVVSLSELIEGHVRLLRVELAADARAVGLEVAKIAAFAPLLLVGYGFVCVALALFFQRFFPADLSFLLVGLINLLVGLAGIALAASRLKQRPLLARTEAEVDATAASVLKAVGQEAPGA